MKSSFFARMRKLVGYSFRFDLIDLKETRNKNDFQSHLAVVFN